MPRDRLDPESARGIADRVAQAFRALSLVAFAALVSAVSARALILLVYEPAIARTFAGLIAVERVHAAMLNQETGLRGYLLARDPRYLEPYHRGVAVASSETERATRELAGTPELTGSVLQMRVSAQLWTNGWASIAATLPAVPGPDDAFLGRGRALFDRYRRDHRALQRAIDVELAADQRRLRLLVLCASIVGGTLFLSMLALMRRHFVSLRRTIVRPIDDLLAATRQIGGGAATIHVDENWPREMRNLGESLAEMAAALAEARALSAITSAQNIDRAERLRQVLDMAREFSSSLDLRTVLRTVATSGLAISGDAEVIVWLIDDEQGHLVAAYDSGAPEGAPRGLEPCSVGHGLAGRAAKYGRAATMSAEARASITDPEHPPVSGRAVPMTLGGSVVGVLEFVSHTPREASASAIEMTDTLASHAVTAIEAALLHQRAEQRSERDALTHLLNRWRLESDLAAECDRSVRYQRPLSFVMIDVDEFKSYNDSFGHPQGDAALREVASVLSEGVRSTDRVYRYGGEEFAIIATETSAAGGRELAERLREMIARRFVDGRWRRAMTASFGVADLHASGGTPDLLISSADRALYRAKRSGRNRVVVGDPLPVGLPSTSASAGPETAITVDPLHSARDGRGVVLGRP